MSTAAKKQTVCSKNQGILRLYNYLPLNYGFCKFIKVIFKRMKTQKRPKIPNILKRPNRLKRLKRLTKSKRLTRRKRRKRLKRPKRL